MNEINEENYRRLKQEIEEVKAGVERAKGALDQLMKQLKKEFNCDSVKEAKSFLKELEAKRARALEKFQKAIADYEEKWGQK